MKYENLNKSVRVNMFREKCTFGDNLLKFGSLKYGLKTCCELLELCKSQLI